MGDEPGDLRKDHPGRAAISKSVLRAIRNRPLEVSEVSLPSGQVLRVPTSCNDHRTEFCNIDASRLAHPYGTTETAGGSG